MYKNLIKQISLNTKKSYIEKTDNTGKILNIISNKGLQKGGIAIRKNGGEYTGFSVMVLEDVKPMLTRERIIRIIKSIEIDDIKRAIRILNVDNEVIDEGINIIYEILCIWLEKNDIDPPLEFKNKRKTIKSKKLIKWITTRRYEPLMVKIKIVGIGESKKGNSVVPESWIDRVFKNGDELHREIDKLDWRKGKPLVHFCCVHNMNIKDNKIYLDEPLIINPQVGLKLIYENDKFETNIIQFKSKDEYKKWVNTKYDILTNSNKLMVIMTNLSNITRKPIYKKTDNVGILVSRLQKFIRRGPKCSILLKETIKKLAQAPQYNLPSQQFIRVSGSRQLLWRLFITIIEDVEPYLPNDCLSLTEIIILAFISQCDPNVQFNDIVIEKIIRTSLLLQHNKRLWDWRKGKNKPIQCDINSSIGGILKLCITFMPMMLGDKILLRRGYNILNKYKLKKLDNISNDEILKLNDKKYSELAIYASYDMHCLPNILILLQGCLPFLPFDKRHTLKNLASFIWLKNSKYNIRENKKILFTKEERNILMSLNNLQKYYYKNKNLKHNVIENEHKIEYIKEKNSISEIDSRNTFLLLFGKKIQLPKKEKYRPVDVIIAGDINNPLKIKYSSDKKNQYLSGNELIKYKKRFIELMKPTQIILPKPPTNYTWIFKTKHVVINIKFNKKFKFYVNKIKIKPFEGKKLLKPVEIPKEIEPDDDIKTIIKNTLQYKKTDQVKLNFMLRSTTSMVSYKWIHLNKMPFEIWKNVIIKLYNNYNDQVQIGPVDRRGKKLQESISYLYEGVLWRIFNFLSFMYPKAVKTNGLLRFKLNKNCSEYSLMITNLNKLAFKNSKETIANIDSNKNIKIITKLWDHQKKTVDEIIYKISKGRRGFGDASNVGMGKTLTALSIMSKLTGDHTGYLVLLPTVKLYKTWEDEINKHTEGFNIIKQQANGSHNEIKKNSIVITTLGRMRDHPISNKWIFVVIDECLSVQNKQALQTEEAWRQIICSQFGVYMMSATFFRSRFEKLFYMLKMLQSGLPENKEYLDTILSECIVCNIQNDKRKWLTNVNKFKLDKKLRKKYDKIRMLNLSSEKMYSELVKLIHNEFNYIKLFENVINKLKGKCLIYAKSKKEADDIAKLDSVTRYPDKKGKHIVVSYSEGAYGLNDLVKYNTIITRPYYPDILFQMKGRLDRHGQKKNILNLEYILLENTIEEAWLLRLEMTNNFYKNHIMPLATFYDLAVSQ